VAPEQPLRGAFVLAACSSSGDPAGSDLASRIDVIDSSVLACSPAPSAPPSDFTVVLDSIAIPAASTYPYALQTNRRETDDGEPFYFAKTGLYWRGDATFEIDVPDEMQDRLAINWAGGDQPKAHLDSADCNLDTESAGAPGGYWVTEPICAETIVRVDGVEQREQIGLGTPCPGQEPPQGPSDA
jgi:hypothetical protein